MKAETPIRQPDEIAADTRAGFTLIEVLAAMIILAVGLLALEALGIYAARSVTLAQRQTEYTLVASRHLEAAIDSIDRLGVNLPCGTRTWPSQINSGTVQRTVAGTSGQRRVLVEVIPATGSTAVNPQNFQLETYVFVPNAGVC